MCIGMFERKGTQEEKLQATLEKTGSAVFIGIGLTKFAGVIVLALAASTIFRLYYFRMYLGIVLLGIFNGLVLLPILLYRFGPRSYEEVSSLVTTNK
jgi:Niemann-Pick C1 protein